LPKPDLLKEREMMSTINTGMNAKLGQEQFLQLMMAQLNYQNPLEPVKQEDFLSQMAQFSTLSGIETLNANFSEMFRLQSLTQGADLLGKEISYFSRVSQQDTTGTVEAVKVQNGKLVLNVNGENLGIDDVNAVLKASQAA
jgi:flagellar basal-body rod modification protein FlgD